MPQAAVEQPVQQDSSASGIYSMDDAISNLIDTPRDGESIEAAQEVAEEITQEAEEEVTDDTVEETEVEEDSDTEEQDSDEEQPDSDDDEQPDASEVTLPSDDVVIAEDGDTKITLGEFREEYLKLKSDNESLQSNFTKKSQKIAEQVKSVEAQETKALAHYQAVVNSLGQSLQQLDQTTNWQQLKQTDMAEFQTKLNQRNQMEAQLQQFGANAEQLLADSTNARAERHQAESQQAVAFLAENINGWNQELYTKVATHAESMGMTDFMSLRDGPVIKAFHDQMRAQEARNTALSKVTNKAPKEAKQKAKLRDSRKPSEKKQAKLKERINKGDKSAAIELLMSQPRE